MRKRFISVCITAILVFSIYDHAQTAVVTPAARTETAKTENTDAAYAELKIAGTADTEVEREEEQDASDVQTAIAEDAPAEESDAYEEQWLGEHVSGIRISGITQGDVDRIAGMENLDLLEFSISGGNIDLSPLGRLPHLRELTIFFTTDTDNLDLSFVKELRYLTTIYFDKCTSLEDLSLFEDMRCLEDLHVGYVDDVDLNYFSGCVNLESINICGSHIRNVEGLSDLMSIHSLALMESAPGKEPIMTDLEQISNLKGLEGVQLRFINVSDAGLLSDLPNLRRIFLVDTGISDIESLNSLERLESLDIFGNKSERVKEQAEVYFKDVEEVTITENIPNNLRNYQ